MAYHRGITMHKLPVDGNIIGAVFATAVILMVAMGVPQLRWVLVGAALLGAILSVYIFRWNRGHKIEIDDLSALEESRDKTPQI